MRRGRAAPTLVHLGGTLEPGPIRILTLRGVSLGRGLLSWIAPIAVVLALSAGTAGCGGSSERADAPPPPAQPEDFPKAKGKTLAELQEGVGDEGPVLIPSVSELEPGGNRFGFGLFDRAMAQIADAPVAIYVAPRGGGPARGPFLAQYESLAVKPQFQSETVSSDPDAAKSLYVAELPLPKDGSYDVLGLARLDNRLVAATPVGRPLVADSDRPSPDVGDSAPRISTETTEDSGGDAYSIDTREPPSTMHDTDFADVVGKKPVILLLATPALCQSRVCGPVADIAEQVKADRGDEAVFIHQEIFRDNEVEKGFRPQFAAWNLITEPWLFAIDRRGRIAARMEGAYSAEELERAVDAAVGS